MSIIAFVVPDSFRDEQIWLCTLLKCMTESGLSDNEGDTEVPDWFEAAVQKLVAQFDMDAPMGPDYNAAAVISAN